MSEIQQSETEALPSAEADDVERNFLSPREIHRLYAWLEAGYTPESAWQATTPELARLAAADLGFVVTQYNIRRARNDVYPRPKPVAPKDHAAQLAGLEKAIDTLAAAVEAMERRVARLEFPSLFPHT